MWRGAAHARRMQMEDINKAIAGVSTNANSRMDKLAQTQENATNAVAEKVEELGVSIVDALLNADKKATAARATLTKAMDKKLVDMVQGTALCFAKGLAYDASTGKCDVNECFDGLHKCHKDATCFNTVSAAFFYSAWSTHYRSRHPSALHGPDQLVHIAYNLTCVQRHTNESMSKQRIAPVDFGWVWGLAAVEAPFYARNAQ